MSTKNCFIVQCKDNSGKCQEIGYDFKQDNFFINKEAKNIINFPGEMHTRFTYTRKDLFKQIKQLIKA